MATKFLRAKPVEVQLENDKGEIITLRMEEFTTEKANRETEIVNKIRDEKRDIDVYKCIREKLSNYFDQPVEFFDQFDQRIINKVHKFMQDQILNPT